MAKKKTTITETEETTEDPKQEIDYQEDIKDKSLKDIASEKTEEVEEKKEEPKSDPVATEVKEEDPKPEIDLEENNRKIAEETAKKTREEIADLLKGDPKEEEKKDAYTEWAEKYTEDTGKSPTWVEAAKFIKDQAKAELIAEQQEAYKAQQEAQTKQAEQEQGYEKQLNSMIDEELNELYASGKLTRIKDKEDPNDPGVRERKALMQTMYDVNVKRAQTGASPIYSVARIHSNYFKGVNRQPAGADAMITNNRAGSAPTDEGDYEYVKDIKGKGWKSFFGRK